MLNPQPLTFAARGQKPRSLSRPEGERRPPCLLRRKACIFGKIGSGGLAAGKLVAAFVLHMPGMTAQPVKRHVMPLQQRGQALPEIHILHGLFVGFDPVFFLPAPEPALGDSMTDILRIRIQGHGAGFAQGLQRPQHRLELHAVVGRQPRSTGEFPAMGRSVQPQNGRPTSRARIAETGSVRINGDISHSAVHTARKDFWGKGLSPGRTGKNAAGKRPGGVRNICRVFQRHARGGRPPNGKPP